MGSVLALGGCRWDFDHGGADAHPNALGADGGNGTDADANADADGGTGAGAGCTASSADLATDRVLDVKASGDLIAILQLDTASSRLEILPVDFAGSPRLPIVLTDGSWNNTAVLARLVVEDGRVRTCAGRVLDGFDVALFDDIVLDTGSLSSTRLCFPGVHCNQGCQVATHAPNLMTARISEITGPDIYQMKVANHDAQGNVAGEQTVADLGSVLGAEYAGAVLAVRTFSSGVTNLIAVDGSGARTAYAATIDGSRLAWLGNQLYLLRGASGFLDLLPLGADAVPAAPEFTVKTSATRFRADPSVLRAGGTTWLAWSDGTTAGLGAVDAQGGWREVASWPQAQNAWVAGAGNGVTVVLDRGDHVTVQRVCP